MFHVEIRMSIQVMREFNLDERTLWSRFLAPLLADREFSYQGHDWEPRKTRIMILEGPELRSDQLAMGRGWQNAQRAGTDVTQAVLARARELHAQANRPPRPASTGSTPIAGDSPGAGSLRERLIGRLAAGPLSVEQITAMAASLLPDGDAEQHAAACQRAVWDLIASGEAQLSANDR